MDSLTSVTMGTSKPDTGSSSAAAASDARESGAARPGPPIPMLAAVMPPGVRTAKIPSGVFPRGPGLGRVSGARVRPVDDPFGHAVPSRWASSARIRWASVPPNARWSCQGVSSMAS